MNALSEGWAQMLRSMSGVTLPSDLLPTLQQDYLRDAAALWNQTAGTSAGAPAKPADRRFAGDDWSRNPASAFTAGMYLLNARTLLQLAEAVQADEKTRARIRFAVQQWIDAVSPSNYLALNPEAQRKAIETRGESIAQGLQHLWQDIRQGHMSQTDESLFEVGRNVATTEGAVVFENELIQLVEYKPLTTQVHERPLLIVPPCINKFYILDLQPQNSFVRHAVEQGHRVFMLSWVNADESLGERTWDDYIEDAAIRAIDEVRAITKQERINTLGFCIGGTILATALAVLAARGEKPAASMTLLTSFLDFSDTGVLDLFVDEAMVSMREAAIGQRGLLKGGELAATFSFLRPNDLVWNYVVGNYLKGETPPPFDLLYWNSDSTNLPGPMYCWYLRNTYLENNLVVPGKLTVCGEAVDLRKIGVPTFIYASREDHIVPWKSAYANTRVLSGPLQFVLGASGHIAGVINPPKPGKRSHWIGKSLPAQADDWLALATEHPGSWWPAWYAWLKPLSGKPIAAPRGYGDRSHKAIEPAPGRYVKQRA
ncbi:PHA/PHB synthase family protein [Caldimonas sp. KR1-144]|uniref:PHA/PHB synthase family protein n=1 Tax=Caldimonas sp. KR1-144 TaxID=3400911 RepID=UPI003BFB6D9D